jgi:PKD repeat protein
MGLFEGKKAGSCRSVLLSLTLFSVPALSQPLTITHLAAGFNTPTSVAVDGSGNVYVADEYNHTIRKVTPAGVVSTVAGLAGVSGSADGTGSAARFYYPSSVAVDGSGNVYVADFFNHTVRRISPSGVVSTLAGLAGVSGSADGTGSAARFTNPWGMAVDDAGTLYVADKGNSTIRKVTPNGVVSTIAGLAGNPGSADGPGSAARFYGPSGVAVDGSGNIYVGDQVNNTVRKVTPVGAVSTLAGLAGLLNHGSADGTGSAARFYNPMGVAVDASGNVYVADSFNCTIRKIDAATRAVTTVAGSALQGGNKDGTGAAARFYSPMGVAVDISGNVFIADSGNNRIRKGTVVALADAATIDASAGYTGQIRQLDTSPQTATRWLWEVAQRPSGSTALLSSTTIRNPTFTPDAPGSYVFQLTASDDFGLQNISSVSLTATSHTESVAADFTWSANPVAGQTIQFTDMSTGSPTSWSWDFGDGFSSTMQSPSHAFATAGAFAVMLTASNSVGSNSTTKTVTVASAGASTCVEDAATMCLVGGRYRIASHWRNQYAGSAVSTLSKAKLTDATGAFWLTDPNTYEYLIRINTATDNNRAWIAIPTFTDVEFWIDVTDTVSGQSKEYRSEPGNRTLVYDPFTFVYP